MMLLHPGRLWLLLTIPLLIALYLVLQRRRRHAVRFTNVTVVAAVAPRSGAWRRHVPAVLIAAAVAALVTAFATPTANAKVPKETATVMLAIDVSASMHADDVSPTRLDAAIEAASSFVDDLPAQYRVGLVAFDSRARVVTTPTTDHAAVVDGIKSLTLGPGTAAGDALEAAIDAVEASLPAGANAEEEGATIVLLSDGVTTVGRSVLTAAQTAARAGIPVSTIAFGTDHGVVNVRGEMIPVPADPNTMAEVAELTSGKFFEAGSGDELQSVYDDIGKRVGYETERRDASGPVLLGSTAALIGALGFGLLWNGRLA